MKVLMVGATGKYASLVLPELKKRGAQIRALAQTSASAEAAGEAGADETTLGSLNDEQSLRRAVTGVDAVFHINPAFAPNEADMGMAMVEAAVAAGVEKFTFSGVIHPSISRMRNHSGKRPVEEALYESGLNFTVLQPTMFMQTLDAGWQEITDRGTFSLPYSVHKKASYVDYRDVAEVAALALTGSTLDYGTFELCAQGMVSRVELTQLMSEVLGKPIEPRENTFEEFAATAHLPEGPFRDGMQRMYDDYDRFGFPGGNALVLRAILGREPRTLRAFLQEHA